MSAPRLLIALGVLFVGAFAFQRARSPWLLIEAHAGEAAGIATRSGLSLADVMALWSLDDGATDLRDLEEEAQRLSTARAELGDALLAVLWVRGRPDLARELRRQAAAGGETVAALVHRHRAALEAVRFASARERFVARGW